MEILQNGLFTKLTESLGVTDGFGYYALFIGLFLVVVIASYLLGGVNSAIVVSRALYKEDIRTQGSGNAGMTNMLRTYGKGAAFLTWFGDMLKTVLSILLAAVIFGFGYKNFISLNGICYFAGLSAVFGHVFPIYYGFKGGKGVLVTAITAMMVCPPIFVVFMSSFVIIVAITRYVSLASCIVASLFPVAVTLYSYFLSGRVEPLTVFSTVILGAFIVWCHRSNIQRLRAGNEKKISIGKKGKKG